MTQQIITLPGAGKDVAVDRIAGVDYQQVKLVDGTLDSTIKAKVVDDNPLPADGGLVVRQAPEDVWQESFSDVDGAALSSNVMSQIFKSASVGVSQSGGNLVLTAGTTANAEFLARSSHAFYGAMIARHKTILSQRIAQNNFAILLADLIGEGLSVTINGATSISVTKTAHGFTAKNVGQFMLIGAISGAAGVPGRYAIASIPDANTINFTVAGWPASGSCTITLFGHNYVRTLYDSTTATNAKVDAQRNGWASGDTTATINTTASPGHVMQTAMDGRNIYWSDSLVASSTTPTVTVRASRIEVMPDDDKALYYFIWLYNGTTNPASGTTWTIGFIAVEDMANVPTFIAGMRPTGFAAPLPVVQTVAGPTQPVSGTVTANIGTGAIAAGTNAIGDVGVQYRASNAGAASGAHVVSAATTNPTVIKASSGRLLGWCLTNNAAAKVYVKFHNQTTSPTAGTGVVRSVGIPAGGTVVFTLEGGIEFTTGIAMTIVTGAADSDATAVAANDVVGDIFYK
jgi:hypothetical protein